MAFTRNPSTGLPATYTGTNEVDALVLIDQPSQITIDGLDASDSIIVTAAALDNQSLSSFLIYGNDGSDTITISQATTFTNSLIQGGNGDDFIFIAPFTLVTGSTIRGGADDDLMQIGGVSASTVNGSRGSDTVSVSGIISNSRIFGGADNDEVNIAGAMRNSRANGSDGADTMNILGGTTMVDSTVFGGAGNDDINIDTDNDVAVSGDNGNDIITVNGDGDNSIVTGNGNDEVIANFAGGDNSIDTGVGADIITLTNTLGDNSITFDRGDSVASSASTVGATLAGALITFGNGVDRIIDFAATDEIAIDFTQSVALTTLLAGDLSTTVLSSTVVYELRGALVGNVFTQAAGGTEALYIIGGGNLTADQALASSTNIVYSNALIGAGDFV